MKVQLLLSSACLAALMAAADPAFAQSAGPTSEVSEVIVTGTRQGGVKAVDSAAPIQSVGNAALKRTGFADLPNALAASVPSLNVEVNANDTARLTVSAALRGLNPNDTLVLVDGKRRHTTANLAVDGGSSYSGAATTDLSFVPIGEIDHVEVLTDGAAAQYGSDAIGGVVNIILKHGAAGGSISATGGQYYEGDGENAQWSINDGVALGDKGFLNFTLEEHYHGFSEQGHGDIRYQSPNGAFYPGLSSVLTSGIGAAANFPRENEEFGDAAYNLYSTFFNAGYDLGGGVQAYAFGSYGHREAEKAGNYRAPTAVSGIIEGTTTTVYPIADGFSPLQKLEENDYSVTAGLKGALAGWNWDLSSTYGGDVDDMYTVNSANPNLFSLLQSQSTTALSAQRNFRDGGFSTTEWTNDLDVNRNFAVGLASPLNAAAGLEARRDTFEISGGEPASYTLAGSQGYIGFTPLDVGGHSRTNYSGYIDLAVDPIANLHTDLAGRYEDYSDFGSATVGKFTARYDFTPAFALRGTISNGFRAPTLAEEYYSGSNVGPINIQVQLPPNSPSAALAGFSPLKPEKSTNYSVGFVAHPLPDLQITADIYKIDISDRILVSGFLYGSEQGFGTNGVVSQGVLNAITSRGIAIQPVQFVGIGTFANAGDTSTEGAELTATYSSDFGAYGHVDWSAGFNYNDNRFTKLASLPAAVANPAAGQTNFLTPQAESALTTGTPRAKAVLQSVWTEGQWSATGRATIYGPASEDVSLNGSGSGAGAYDERIGVTPIFDLDVGYKVRPDLRFNVGANNLFNKFPPNVPLISAGGLLRPTDGSLVYGVPYPFAPWGINGGYYYGRITYNF